MGGDLLWDVMNFVALCVWVCLAPWRHLKRALSEEILFWWGATPQVHGFCVEFMRHEHSTSRPRDRRHLPAHQRTPATAHVTSAWSKEQSIGYRTSI